MKPQGWPDPEILTVVFTADEVKAMVRGNDEKILEFGELLRKYTTWLNDIKKIRTKELLARK